MTLGARVRRFRDFSANRVILAFRWITGLFGVAIVRAKSIEKLESRSRADARTLRTLTRLVRMGSLWDVSGVLDYAHLSRSQLSQDLLVLAVLGAPRSGFFVEFGATNGFDLSNTFLLEKEFGWRGILAEPARRWWRDLEGSRDCAIDKRCVWSESGAQLLFKETAIGELSTIDVFSSGDLHAENRENGHVYPVETISLMDLLSAHGAPALIDYLSIDTEGSEYEILSQVDFSRYSFRVLTVEHNYTPMRESIFDLLTANGYRRILENLSDFDDWYVHTELS